MKPLFVTGIGTEVGKTVVSAILVEALQADYWKPVQAGDLEHTDTDKVRALVTNAQSVFHPETYRLKHAMSPHAAAALENIAIKLRDFEVPQTANSLIIEGAGGLLVPINSSGDTILDMIAHFEVEVVLVSKFYLGSINHTLLSIATLKNKGIPIKGVVFNGVLNAESEQIILETTGVRRLGYIPWEEEVTPAMVQQYAKTMSHELV